MDDFTDTSPVVSIITPVYNGGRFLAECIESVLDQTFTAFEHVLVDNASTDDTRDIVARYASCDRRVKLVACADHVSVLPNWNRALDHISPFSKYVWVLPADDAMMPPALSRMVALAERNPSVGIVASLRSRGGHIQCSGLPTDRSVFSGREIVRLFLRQEVFAFSPTGSLIRRDLIDAHRPFYPEKYLHADIAAFFNVLDSVDFGFVHEVLMFSREHENSITSTVANRGGTQFRDGLLMLQEYGPRYFEPHELEDIENRFLRWYYRFLVRRALLLWGRQFFAYHTEALRQAQRLPGVGSLARAVAVEMKNACLHPEQVIRHIRARLSHQ